MGGNLSTLCSEDELHEVCESMYVEGMPKKEIVALTEGHIAETVAQEQCIDPSLYRRQIVQLYDSLSDTDPTSFVAFVGYTKCVMQVLRVARNSARRKKDGLGSSMQQVTPLDETNLKQWNLITESTLVPLAQGVPNSKVQHLMMDKTVPIRDVPDDYVVSQPKYCQSSSSSNQKKLEKLVEAGFDPKFQAVLLMAGASDLIDCSAESIIARIRNLHCTCHKSGRPTILFLLPESLTSTRDVTIRNKRLQVNHMLQEWAKHQPQIIAVVNTGKLMPYDGGEFWEPDGHLMTPLGTKVFYERLREDLSKALQGSGIAVPHLNLGSASSSTAVPHATLRTNNGGVTLNDMTQAPFLHNTYTNAPPQQPPQGLSPMPQASLFAMPTKLGFAQIGFKPFQTMFHVPSLEGMTPLTPFTSQPNPTTATLVAPLIQGVPPLGTNLPLTKEENGAFAAGDTLTTGAPVSHWPAAAPPSVVNNNDDIDRTRLPANYAGGLKTSAPTRGNCEPLLIQPMGDMDVSMDVLRTPALNTRVFTTPVDANVISTHPTSWDTQIPDERYAVSVASFRN
eukprot:GEMP01044214.1.p1 GENE.GEMP01044214.1~~GEMP01044214.1.p1  ORF type:complete len:564 (-),score=105.89 GEMP01044214.1:53-1744(-)